MGGPRNPNLDPFPDPVHHFWAPWQSFWIFEVYSNQNIIYLIGESNNLGLDLFKPSTNISVFSATITGMKSIAIIRAIIAIVAIMSL